MSTFQKQLLEKLHKEFKSDLVSDLGSTSDEDLEDHFIDQLEFRENILSSQQGYINCILEVDESTSKNLSQNLRKIKEKASPFTAGMKPTNSIQPPTMA